MSASPKYYVVWIGLSPGIYDSWEKCKNQVEGWKGAVYKGFSSLEEAEKAYSSPPELYFEKSSSQKIETPKKKLKELPDDIIRQAFAVDAACSGNPGKMEYRGIYLGDMEEKFHFGPVFGTNNIGEFLAIVHALALLKKKGLDWPIYSDSRNAILWIRQKKCKTKLEYDERTSTLFETIRRAEKWLDTNKYSNKIIKWDTDRLGEIPADFGRK